MLLLAWHLLLVTSSFCSAFDNSISLSRISVDTLSSLWRCFGVWATSAAGPRSRHIKCLPLLRLRWMSREPFSSDRGTRIQFPFPLQKWTCANACRLPHPVNFHSFPHVEHLFTLVLGLLVVTGALLVVTSLSVRQSYNQPAVRPSAQQRRKAPNAWAKQNAQRGVQQDSMLWPSFIWDMYLTQASPFDKNAGNSSKTSTARKYFLSLWATDHGAHRLTQFIFPIKPANKGVTARGNIYQGAINRRQDTPQEEKTETLRTKGNKHVNQRRKCIPLQPPPTQQEGTNGDCELVHFFCLCLVRVKTRFWGGDWKIS